MPGSSSSYPRISAMYSSVVPCHLISADPMARSNLSGLGSLTLTLRRMASPWPRDSITTLVPGLMSRASRTTLGIVTCPLLVTVVAAIELSPRKQSNTYCNTKPCTRKSKGRQKAAFFMFKLLTQKGFSLAKPFFFFFLLEESSLKSALGFLVLPLATSVGGAGFSPGLMSLV